MLSELRVALQCNVLVVAVSDPFVSMRQLSSGSEYKTKVVEVSNPIFQLFQ